MTPVSQIQEVRFAFQMYGKTDPYVSGTTLYLDTWGDGAERILELDDAVWSEVIKNLDRSVLNLRRWIAGKSQCQILSAGWLYSATGCGR